MADRVLPTKNQIRIPTTSAARDAIYAFLSDLNTAVTALAGADASAMFEDKTGIIRSVDVLGTDTATNGTSRLVFANAAFTAADVGRRIRITGSVANNLVFTIATVVNATTVTTTVAPTDEAFAGTETCDILGLARTIAFDAADAVVAATKTFTLTNGAFVASDVGRKLLVADAAVAGNNQVYTIATRVSATTVTVVEAPGGNETFVAARDIQVHDSAYVLSPTGTSFVAARGTTLFALGNGTTPGQTKKIRCTAATDTPALTLRPAEFKDGSTLAFNADLDYVELVWTADGWRVLTNTSVTVA